MKKLFINLRLFDVNYNTNVTTSDGMTPEMHTYYDKQLLEDCKPNLIHGQFAQKRNIPKGNSKTINWRRFNALGKCLTPLTEGVTPDGQTAQISKVEATAVQYGGYVATSDVIDLTAVDPVVVELGKLVSNQAGLTLDTIVRNAIVSGTVVQYATGEDGAEVASRSALTKSHKVKVDDILRAVRTLKRKNVPTINGYYIAIVHPDNAYELSRDPEFREWHKYAKPEELYEGELGKIGKCRFVESSEAIVWKDNSCPDGLAVYGTLVFGADAYGDTEIDGGGLEMIVKPLGSGGTADPLNQRSTVGWKAFKTAKILAEDRMVRIESCSSYSDLAEAN